jgi:multidrug efflux pump subunit AcrB
MLNSFSDKNAINDTLRKLGHDITKISKALATNLEELGIKEITENGSQYKVITTNNKEIYVENFIKIRYDFLDNVRRNVNNQEHKRIKEYTKTLTDLILRKAKQKNSRKK